MSAVYLNPVMPSWEKNREMNSRIIRQRLSLVTSQWAFRNNNFDTLFASYVLRLTVQGIFAPSYNVHYFA